MAYARDPVDLKLTHKLGHHSCGICSEGNDLPVRVIVHSAFAETVLVEDLRDSVV